LRVLFFGTPSFAVPTLDALLASPDAVVVGEVTQADKPRGRGQQVSASPIKEDGDRETGVTIMRVVKALDAGAMLAVARTPIDPDETGEALEARLSEIGASLLVSTLPALADGSIREVPQDEGLVTLAPRIAKTDGLIDWDAP